MHDLAEKLLNLHQKGEVENHIKIGKEAMFSTKRIVSPFPTPKLDCHHDIKAGFWLAEIKHLVNNCHCY